MGDKETLLKELEAAKRAIEEKERALKATEAENAELRKLVGSSPEEGADVDSLKEKDSAQTGEDTIEKAQDNSETGGSDGHQPDGDSTLGSTESESNEKSNTDSEAESDGDESNDESKEPSDELEAIRRHAARTLVWANSAIKRSSNSNLMASPTMAPSLASSAATASPPVVPRTINFTRETPDDQSCKEEENAPCPKTSLEGINKDKTPDTQSVGESSYVDEFYKEADSFRSDGHINDSYCNDSLSHASYSEISDSPSNAAQKKGPFAGIKDFLEDTKLAPPKPKRFFSPKGKTGMTPLQERQAMQRAQQRAFLKEKGILKDTHNPKEIIEERQAAQKAQQIAFLKERGLLNDGSVPGTLSDAGSFASGSALSK